MLAAASGAWQSPPIGLAAAHVLRLLAAASGAWQSPPIGLVARDAEAWVPWAESVT